VNTFELTNRFKLLDS